MYQSFSDYDSGDTGADRLGALRKILKQNQLDGFFVPRSDQYMNEYVPACAERLAWLTGFTGSAGLAIILLKKAALFTDGRYRIQAREQVNIEHITPLFIPQDSPQKWLEAELNAKNNRQTPLRIGYDPILHSFEWATRFTAIAQKHGAELVACGTNPIDEIWQDQPAPPLAPIAIHPMKYAGQSPGAKIEALQNQLQQEKIDAALITLPENSAWLFNIRGQDVPHTPLPLCFTVLHAKKKPALFIAPEKLTPATKRHLEKHARIYREQELETYLEGFAKTNPRVRIAGETTPALLTAILLDHGAEINKGADPCTLPKAIKNKVEIEGMRAAHLRDGVALTRFLFWLDQNANNKNANTGTAKSPLKIDEISAAQKLESLRADTGALKEISFDTISGAGPNGAIVHYRVTTSSNRPLKKNSLYLVDSGAQYLDGTTDVTRTIAIGSPSKEMRLRFTQVLKGHISLALARFPANTRGVDLDILARHALWQAGVDYDHGTGHGIGSYLSVHEGPQGISKRNMIELKPGMILSNEPGYYKEGHWGIRIENLILVREAEEIKGGERAMHHFETLTLAPIDPSLIEADLLTREEKKWLNDYHSAVYRALAPHLASAEKSWLKAQTAAL